MTSRHQYRTKAILEILDVIPAASVPPATQIQELETEPENVAKAKQEAGPGAGENQDVQQELLAEVRAMRVRSPVNSTFLTNRNKWLQWKRT